jgi:TetR/AcrR family transcriptional regulator, transcriptional repressor for nem operon
LFAPGIPFRPAIGRAVAFMNAVRISPASADGDLPIRGRIREVATEMLIRNGYQGFRFRDIADALQTTRTNVHYHFGHKETLCEEVIVAYVDETRERFEAVWSSAATFEDKVLAMMESNRERYLKYNPAGDTAHPWSLIARMRLEREVISDKARQVLADFSAALETMVSLGIRAAIRERELRPDAPVEDIALQLVAIVNSADPITQDAGSFDRLETLYRGLTRIVLHAYGLEKPSARGFAG